ncbi:alpha/beta hydrolase [Bradyrhizobium sp. DASA03007]|uniref:alpha/beta hydrolase n=1 Tax=unclassified Bradyrhizobium TaxID=2631580 RepID=UPI003F709774
MPFDPDCAAFVARLRELGLPRYETMTPQQAREAMAAARKAAAIVSPAIPEARDIVAQTAEGSLCARIYRPTVDAEPRPTLIFFHGGGWVLGDLDSHDILCRRLSIASKATVIAFDYRLAPENKFPAAVNDAIAAVNWVFENARGLQLDPDRIGVGGDSAGANLAAIVAHHCRNEGSHSIAFQLLIYPAVDMTFSHPSHRLDEAALPVLGSTMVWFREFYLSTESDRKNWRASPLLAGNFSNLPPSYVLTAGFDPLADEGAAYVEKLFEAGVPVFHRHFPGQIHGFLTMGPQFPTTEGAVFDIGKWMQTF